MLLLPIASKHVFTASYLTMLLLPTASRHVLTASYLTMLLLSTASVLHPFSWHPNTSPLPPASSCYSFPQHPFFGSSHSSVLPSLLTASNHLSTASHYTPLLLSTASLLQSFLQHSKRLPPLPKPTAANSVLHSLTPFLTSSAFLHIIPLFPTFSFIPKLFSFFLMS